MCPAYVNRIFTKIIWGFKLSRSGNMYIFCFCSAYIDDKYYYLYNILKRYLRDTSTVPAPLKYQFSNM